MATQPIEVPDDGLRLVSKTQIRGFEAVRIENPILIAIVIAEKRRRRMIQNTNYALYG